MYYFHRSDKFILNSEIPKYFVGLKENCTFENSEISQLHIAVISVTGWPQIVKSHASSCYKISANAVPIINIDKKAVFLHPSVLNKTWF